MLEIVVVTQWRLVRFAKMLEKLSSGAGWEFKAIDRPVPGGREKFHSRSRDYTSPPFLRRLVSCGVN